jgi:N6-L-threonylcarbamoyladenine synthase
MVLYRLAVCIDEAAQDITLSFPPPSLCTGTHMVKYLQTSAKAYAEDNAAMIAWASMHRFLDGNFDSFDIGPRSKWSLEELEHTEGQMS